MKRKDKSLFARAWRYMLAKQRWNATLKIPYQNISDGWHQGFRAGAHFAMREVRREVTRTLNDDGLTPIQRVNAIHYFIWYADGLQNYYKDSAP